MSTYLIAIALPPPINKELRRLCFALPDAVWKEEDPFFLTLSTFEISDGSQLIDLDEYLQKLEFSPFSIYLKDLSLTPAKRGYIQLQCEASSPLQNLKNGIKKALTLSDIPRKNGEFLYVQLGHFEKISPEKLASYMEANFPFQSSRFEVGQFGIYEVRPTGKRTIYIERYFYKGRRDIE